MAQSYRQRAVVKPLQRFGRLRVVIPEGRRRRKDGTVDKAFYVLCICDCGQLHAALRHHLVKGKYQSCGCLRREKAGYGTHYKTNTPEYSVWCGMLDRCRNPKNKSWSSYGGAGVTVCDRWNPRMGGTFLNFLQDMGERPSPHHQLDKDIRIPGNKVYSPDGCMWATRHQQLRACSTNHLLTLDGISRCVTDWENLYGLSRGRIGRRLQGVVSPRCNYYTYRSAPLYSAQFL